MLKRLKRLWTVRYYRATTPEATALVRQIIGAHVYGADDMRWIFTYDTIDALNRLDILPDDIFFVSSLAFPGATAFPREDPTVEWSGFVVYLTEDRHRFHLCKDKLKKFFGFIPDTLYVKKANV